MSLWVDKHRPTSLAKLDYHAEQASRLSKLVSDATVFFQERPFICKTFFRSVLGYVKLLHLDFLRSKDVSEDTYLFLSYIPSTFIYLCLVIT